MKKILTVVLGCCLLAGCASVKEAQNLANCKFALRNVELTDYNLTTLGFTVVIAITNLNKKQAATLKRFEGELTVNEEPSWALFRRERFHNRCWKWTICY